MNTWHIGVEVHFTLGNRIEGCILFAQAGGFLDGRIDLGRTAQIEETVALEGQLEFALVDDGRPERFEVLPTALRISFFTAGLAALFRALPAALAACSPRLALDFLLIFPKKLSILICHFGILVV